MLLEDASRPCSPHGDAPVTDCRGIDASPIPISARGSAYAYRVEHGAQRVRQWFNRKRFGGIHRTASGARLRAPGGRHRLRQCGFVCALGQVRYRLARCWTAIAGSAPTGSRHLGSSVLEYVHSPLRLRMRLYQCSSLFLTGPAAFSHGPVIQGEAGWAS